MRYSLFNVIVNGLTGNRFTGRAWRDASPKPEYDVIIVGGGGHGLATAYYLAKDHGIRNVAVIEKGWIGSRQRRAQHHDLPLQLSAARQRAVLRMVDEAVGGAGAGAQLQRHGQPARHREPDPFRRPARRLCPARQRHAARTASMPNCSTASRCATMVPLARFRQCALSDQGRLVAGARRHGAARRRGLGLRARRRSARRRHRAELRGHRLSASTDGRGHGRRDDARLRSAAKKVGAGGGRLVRRVLARRPACGCRSKAMCCRPSSPRRSSR